jgi:1,4-dihydroxy-2-naphthoate octaprenyltransferase
VTVRCIWAFIRLTRPLFLLGGALLYALGVTMAARRGVSIRLDLALLGQVMVTAIQLMAHYANEYYDIVSDRLNSRRTWFTGGSGILPGGELDRVVARRASHIAGLVGMAAIVAVTIQSPLAGVVGIISLLGAWLYSAPPLALMGSGWGELSTSLIVALLTPLTGFVLQAGYMDVQVLAVCAPLVVIHLAMLLAFEFPDWEADTAASKRTLVVRLGRERAVNVHAALVAIAAIWLMAASLSWPPARYVWLAIPLAAWQALSLAWRARHDWTSLPSLTLGAAGLFVLPSVLWLLGWLVL